MKYILIIVVLFQSFFLFGQTYECQYFEYYTVWKQNLNILNDSLKILSEDVFHVHNWIEEYDDNTEGIPLYPLPDIPCGLIIVRKEHRLCKFCSLHQVRTKTYGYKQIFIITEYMKSFKRFYSNE